MIEKDKALGQDPELNKDPNAGGEGDGADKGQAGDESKKVDDEENLEDERLKGDEEEEITIKRGELKTLKTNLKNYKTVALSKKGKDGEGKNLSKSTDTPPAQDDDKYVKKAELQKEREDTAIEMATVAGKDDDDATKALKKEIDENWEDIKAFYTGKSGKLTTKDIYEDILDAHAAWKRRHGSSSKNEDGTSADLATSHGTGGTSPKDGQVQVGRKRILTKSGSPKDWY